MILQDEEVLEMIDRFGFVTIAEFMVYSEMETDDANMLGAGVAPFLMAKHSFPHPYLLMMTDVTEELAKEAGTSQGVKLSFVFGGDIPYEKSLIRHLSTGIDFLKMDFEYKGARKLKYGL